MPFEGIPERRKEFERGPSASPKGTSAEREFVLDAKGEEYRSAQLKLAEMEQKLAQGNKSIENEPINSPRRQLAAAIGKEMNREIEALRARKEMLEDDIRNAGGNPSDYTIQ